MPKHVDFIGKAVQNLLQNETKAIKFRQAILEIFNFKDQDLDSFPRKKDIKPKFFFFEVLYRLKNSRLCDVRNDKCTIKQ